MGAILLTCRNRDYVERHVAEALRRAGWAGELRTTGPGEAPRDPEEELRGVSGLLLSGGRDIHPRHWQPPEAPHGRADPDLDRDDLEIPLIRAAWGLGLPLFGICRGSQVLNVALGGSLIQDIPSHFQCPALRHQGGSSESPELHHTVDIVAGTRLAVLLGTPRVEVNSRHHQAVGRLAPELRAAALHPETSAEGVPLIEAVESLREDRWALGVQWHPENLVEREDAAGAAARALFAEFARVAAGPAIIEGCRMRMPSPPPEA